MKRIVFTLLAIMLTLSIQAGWNFQSGTKYYLQCNYNTDCYVVPGSNYGVSYPVYYAESTSNDRYWYIGGDATNGYTFQNVSTGQYLAWSDDYSSNRYLTVSDTEDGNTTRWTLEHNTAGYVVIRSVASDTYVFDMRTGTYQVGTYVRSSGFTSNEQFNIYDSTGTSAWVDEGTDDDGYTEDGYNSTEKWSGSDDVHDFTPWSFSSISTSSSITSTRTETFKAGEGAHVFFDWAMTASSSSSGWGPQSSGSNSFTVTLDGTTIVSTTSTASGSYSSEALTAGTHTIVITYTYTKSGSTRPGGQSTSSTSGSASVTNFFISNIPAKTLTVHCISSASGEELATYDYEFYTKSYTLSEAPAVKLYNYFSGDLPYTATETTDIYLYYSPKDLPKPTTITGGSFASDTQWYRLKIRGSKYLNVSGTSVLCTETTETVDPLYYWCFVKDENGYFSIYNNETGASLPLTATATTNGTALTMSSSGTYQAFDLTDNSCGGFNIQIPNVESCANDFASEGTLKLWTSSESMDDNGSNITFEEVSNAAIIDISSLTFSTSKLSVNLGSTAHLTYTYTPEDATRTTVTWTSSDPDVATVSGGLITAVATGTTNITVTSKYNTSISATCAVTVIDPNAGVYVEHSEDYFYLQFPDSGLIAVPQDYVVNKNYTYANSTFQATLTSGEVLRYTGVTGVSDTNPYPLPTFTSYKFNNKFNYQVFTDVIADDPTANEINLSVGGIGKRLTPSFQLASKRGEVWVGNTLQDSKNTRMRFDKAITYTITYTNWRKLEILERADGTYRNDFKPFGNEQVVNVDWLTDHSTNDYQVPEIYITIDDGSNITDKTTLKDAHIEIKGGGVYPDMASMAVQIKGRGNTSWGGYGSKNPYRLKFSSKQKPLGLTKGKSWILLANKQTGSMTTNAIGQKIASLMESDYPCHIVPVELYINDYYQGSYNFCEKVGISNNSVTFDDESYAAMMELDTYEDEGETPNTQNAYGMNVKINDPNVEDDDYDGELTYDGIFSDFNLMTKQVSYGGEGYTNYVAKKSLVSYLATCELMCNCELKHPKSVFCYSENVTDALDPTGEDPTKWHFGPLWDCDWAFGYEQDGTYFIESAESDFFANLIGSSTPKKFWNALRYNSTAVDSLYFDRWHEFVTEGGLDELIEFCDDYYDFAAPSLTHNPSGQFASDRTDYEDVTSNCKDWLQTRAEHIYNAITHYTLPTTPETGDVNGDGKVDIADIAHLVAIMLGNEKDNYDTGDMNGDGRYDYNDTYLLQKKINGQ